MRWYKDPECKVLHRPDRPAIEYTDGEKWWYFNGKLHRVVGPAVYENDTYQWYINCKRHREDGPAVLCANGHTEWWLYGKQLTQKEHRNRTTARKMTVAQIEAALGYKVEVVV